MSLILLIAQYGATVSGLPPEHLDRKAIEAKRQSQAAAGPLLPTTRSGGCIDEVTANPEVSAMAAQKALDTATGSARLRAGLCLGAALGAMERWDEARTAFLRARDAAAPTDAASRARLGAMAGNAALAAGSATQALPILDSALADARSSADAELRGTIALDRARAFMALRRPSDAALALAEARTAVPNNAQTWLLSATLSRRENKLAEAQTQIERAAQIAAEDPEIGLEAGVIAVLAGRDDAARKSWQSVLATAPSSEAATTAKGYLAQLGNGAKP
jgi:tetratricopeptide (TPR) repeat protein